MIITNFLKLIFLIYFLIIFFYINNISEILKFSDFLDEETIISLSILIVGLFLISFISSGSDNKIENNENFDNNNTFEVVFKILFKRIKDIQNLIIMSINFCLFINKQIHAFFNSIFFSNLFIFEKNYEIFNKMNLFLIKINSFY